MEIADAAIKNEFFELEKQDDVAVMWLDREDQSVNTLSGAALDAVEEALNAIEQDAAIKAAVFISRKRDNFIVGADIGELDKMASPREVEMLSRKAHRLIVRVRGMRKPTVAALHGATMGGGLEMALSCTYRIATDHPKTKFALPEVKLGLLPGGGGTQYLPRLVGIQQALPMMLTGSNVYPKKARRIGLVNVLTHRDGLLLAAKEAARRLADGRLQPDRNEQALPKRLLESNPLTRSVIYKKAKEQVQRETRGNYPAPFRMIECVRIGMEEGLAEGLDAEARAFGELAFSPVARQLLFLFFAKQRAEKNPLADKALPLRRVAVLGAGLMGAGIAEVTATGDLDVLLKDQDLAYAAKGKKEIWQNLRQKVQKGALSDFEHDVVLERVQPTPDYDTFPHVDLVIEAVPEDLDLKHRILRETEAATPEHCIFASNTSSIPITRIAEAADRPANVLGMHYFSPVPRMPLLEIIKTKQTSDEALATAYAAGLRQGKTVIAVNDGPGFYTTRILSIYMNEALELLDEGAEIKQVDEVMQDFGFPMGPYTLFDLVGIDTAAKISEVLGPFFRERGLDPHEGAARLTERDLLGQKNNQGFYHYEAEERGRKNKKAQNEDVYRYFGGADRRKKMDPETIQQRLVLMMVNEAVRCLEEGILDEAEDGDVGAVFGLGFPPFRGGPFRYIDAESASAVLARLERLRTQYGDRFTPAELLREHAQANQRFYEDEPS